MHGRSPKMYTYDGVTGSLSELREHFKWFQMSLSALRWRLRQGMTLPEALALPVWHWQKTHADLATKKLLWAHAQRDGKPRPAKAKKPTHPPEIRDQYFGICRACGSVLLKQSLHDGTCKGGC